MTSNSKLLSVRLPLSDVRRIPGNRSEFVRDAVAEKLARESRPDWRPKTATGRKLLKLRSQFLARGGEMLDADGIAEELRQRRGGLA
jgi:Arc/MetJ-type ribon-helix-helix transcriptional regulator